MKNIYTPEGTKLIKALNPYEMGSLSDLAKAKNSGQILEARAVKCDKDHNLLIDFPYSNITGFMPRRECAIDITDNINKDIAILSLVNRIVCFKVIDIQNKGNTTAILSRKAAQEETMNQYVNKLVPGDIIDARITHNAKFASYADIGCGLIAILPAKYISVCNMANPNQRFRSGQRIKAIIKNIDENYRVCLTHKELLGTWKENASQFVAKETYPGIVRKIRNYGIFVELTPNLFGLADCRNDIAMGQSASVFIHSLDLENKKINMNIVNTFDEIQEPKPFHYFITEGHIDNWNYCT